MYYPMFVFGQYDGLELQHQQHEQYIEAKTVAQIANNDL